MKTLYPFQIQGRDFLVSHRNAILADDMGLGKTIQAIEGAKAVGINRGIILCPLSVRRSWTKVLRDQFPSAFIKEITSPKCPAEPTAFNVINYDIVWREPLIKDLQKYQWPVLIADECFKWDTKIETHNGTKNIIDVRPGDYVKNCLGWSKVLDQKIRNIDKYIKIMYNGKQIEVSRNHPFFTDRGWVYAEDLVVGDLLIRTESANALMRTLREDVLPLCSIERQGSIPAQDAILRHILFSEMENVFAVDKSPCPQHGGIGKNIKSEKALLEIRTAGEESRSRKGFTQLDTGARRKTACQDKRDIETDQMEARSSWWQRETFFSSSKQVVEAVRENVETGICGILQKLTNFQRAYALQDRYCPSRFKDSDRGRRKQSSFEYSEITGFQKRGVLAFYRVESIEVLERRDNARTGQGFNDNTFVDLEIEGHPSFDVNGVLVHNCHKLKNIESKRTKTVLGRFGLYNRCERRWMLTGTPVLNRPVELFPILRSLCPDMLGIYTDFYRYAYRFCSGFQDVFGFNVSGASHLDELSKLLQPVMLRRLKEEVLSDLPEVTYDKVYLEPTNKLLSLSRQEKAEQGQKELDKQIGETSSLRRMLGVLKAEAAIDHLEDLLETKTKAVVFTWHHEVVDVLMAHFKNRAVAYTGRQSVAEKEKAKDDFTSRPEVKLFVGNIDAAGQGVDGLQEVCDVCVFVELSHVPGIIKQAVDRLRRIGQARPVLAQFLVVEDSIDEDFVDNLTSKSKNINTILQERREVNFVGVKCSVCGSPKEMKEIRRAAGLPVCAKCEKLMDSIL